jgi:hypothetical protein
MFAFRAGIGLVASIVFIIIHFLLRDEIIKHFYTVDFPLELFNQTLFK